MTGPGTFTRKRVVALVVAGVVAGGAGGAVISQLGVATAASPSPSPSARLGSGLAAGLAGGDRLLHGDATLAKRGGGTQVVHFQRGVITGASGSTLTVKSSDGFTSTYTVDRSTRITLNGTDGTLSKLAKDDTVRVLGVEDGSGTVAKVVLDGVLKRPMIGGFFHGRLGHGMGRHLMMHGTPSQPGQAG